MWSNHPSWSHRAIAGWMLLLVPAMGQTLYEFGNPTGEEQLYLELINRARANPPAEGARLAATTDPDILSAYAYFKVDLRMMQREFDKITAAPPIAPNANLTGVARSHTLWMFTTATQAHNESNPYNTPFSRISASGYSYTVAAENIYAHANSVAFGHAGFEVDWGAGSGGMLDGRGHRANIHNPNFREIGVGVVLGSNGAVGPQLVTQDFASRFGTPTLATGVAYYDLNGNDFYDVGEGVSGLTVTVSGASHYCTTAAGGGWTVPVPAGSASRTVTFAGLNMNRSIGLTVAGDANAKADLKLGYVPPLITSAAEAISGLPHTLAFTPVGGATGYRCSLLGTAAAAPENCENTAGITTSTTGAYSVLNTSVKAEGAASFQLLNSTAASQWLELNTPLVGSSTSSLAFHSRVGAATTSERFKVQVREEGSAAWLTVYEQVGTGGWGEDSFNPRTVSMGVMAGKNFRIRFLLEFTPGGGYFTNTGSDFGWLIDAIHFTGVASTQTIASGTVSGGSWTFTPGAGEYRVSVIPVISGRDYPGASQNLIVTAPVQAVPSFITWASAMEAAHGLAPGTLSDADGDPDHDGRSNLIEYAFGGSPVSGNDPPDSLPSARLSASRFILRYRVDTSLGDLVVTPQACTAIGAWKTPGEAGAPQGFSDEAVAIEGSIETREASLALGGAGGCFMRVRVSRR